MGLSKEPRSCSSGDSVPRDATADCDARFATGKSMKGMVSVKRVSV